jgi:hypothetical protein
MGPSCVQGADDLFGPPSGKPVDGRRRLATPSRFSEQTGCRAGLRKERPRAEHGVTWAEWVALRRQSSRCWSIAPPTLFQGDEVGVRIGLLRHGAQAHVARMTSRETSRPIYAHGWDGTRGSRWAHCAAAKAPSTA